MKTYLFSFALGCAVGVLYALCGVKSPAPPMREQKLTFRPDWEKVVTAAVDFALTRRDVDGDKVDAWCALPAEK